MNQVLVVVSTSFLALLSNQREQVVVFEEELCKAGVMTAHKERSVLHGMERLNVLDNA